ncbi:hypothetical protein [Hyphomicrobium sulfonivorans]|nr:hypothetical protein [Hyphomicrobium sulfonivorans]
MNHAESTLPEAAPMTANASPSLACGECGAETSGNFCSACGADLRTSALSFLGPAATSVRRSFPAVYLKILRSPIRQTVAFADDRTYRGYVSFALTGIALYILFFVPIVIRMVVPGTEGAHLSESMQTMMKALSQAGIYVGMALTFLLAFALFRAFAPARRPFPAYFKLYAIAIGFVAPIYGIYEFVIRLLPGGVGMSALGNIGDDAMHNPTVWVSTVLALLLWGYFAAIHRRFWSTSVWLAVVLYFLASFISNWLSYHLMWWVGFHTARILIAAGIVTP